MFTSEVGPPKETSFNLIASDLPRGGRWIVCYCTDFDNCDEAADFTADAGRLTVIGPHRDQSLECSAGFACALGPIEGTELVATTHSVAFVLASAGVCGVADKDTATEIAQGACKPRNPRYFHIFEGGIVRS